MDVLGQYYTKTTSFVTHGKGAFISIHDFVSLYILAALQDGRQLIVLGNDVDAKVTICLLFCWKCGRSNLQRILSYLVTDCISVLSILNVLLPVAWETKPSPLASKRKSDCLILIVSCQPFVVSWAVHAQLPHQQPSSRCPKASLVHCFNLMCYSSAGWPKIPVVLVLFHKPTVFAPC